MCNSSIKGYLYEGCGNRFFIVHLRHTFSREDVNLRRSLQQAGLDRRVDSVLVLTGDPQKYVQQGYHVTMDVFEPRGIDTEYPDLPGSWSTMCGNGIRAIARYLMDHDNLTCFIQTGSGLRKTTVLPENQFRVNMGQFTTDRRDISRYVKDYAFFKLIHRNIVPSEVFIGLNGTPDLNGIIDGEPHLVLFLGHEPDMTLTKLERLAMRIGPDIVTSRAYFPQSINANFVIADSSINDEVTVRACTFERGVEYVTRACGTGATAIGAYLLRQDIHRRLVRVCMPGGVLTITRDGRNGYYLTGSANPVDAAG